MDMLSSGGLANVKTMGYIAMVTETPKPGRQPPPSAASDSAWNSGGAVATRGRKKMTTATAKPATTKASDGTRTATAKSTKSAEVASTLKTLTRVTTTKSTGGSTIWFTESAISATTSASASQTATSVLATPTISSTPAPEANDDSKSNPQLVIIIPSVVGGFILLIIACAIFRAWGRSQEAVEDGDARLANGALRRWDPTYGQTAHSPSADEDAFPFGHRAPCPLPRPEGMQNGSVQQSQDEYQLQNLTPTQYGGGTQTEIFPPYQDRGSLHYPQSTVGSQRSYMAYQPHPQHQIQLQPAELPGDSYIQSPTTAGPSVQSSPSTATYIQATSTTGPSYETTPMDISNQTQLAGTYIQNANQN
ncbi:hypothetical protein CKAH01_14943 [Colletotrichum kahawae]|uniref:Uncharacterized protein n=1 Tax=Colletotrichum kahawae TaxID=34407 RepID=A0AAE0D7W1_COLKA|nr:hypothetical protein CKAH01_14943 [Colletotrichum kahawae]